jgi:predicted PurR-regulated permease PerM
MTLPTLPVYSRYVLVTLALLAVALLVGKLAPVLLLVFAGIVIATVIRAASTPLARRTGIPDSVAVSIVSALLVALALLGLWFFGRQLLAQTDELWNAIQVAWDKIQERVADSAILSSAMENAQAAVGGTEAMNKIAKGTFTVFGGLGDLILVAFLAIYLAVNPATYRNGFLALIPGRARGAVAGAFDKAGGSLRKWLLGQLGAMCFVGVVAAIGLSIIGVPMAIPLGILLGVLDFVPVVGPLIGALPGVVIAFAQGPDLALKAIAVYVAVQFIEGHLVIPIAQKWAVSMPPALALTAIVAAGLLFGFPGIFFALPLAVVATVLVRELYAERIK